MGTIFELRNIYKNYGVVQANKNISLSIEKGSIHSIVGENGAGKSTLMNILSGVVIPSSGTIILRGKEVSFRNANDATHNGIGMVQQEFMLFNNLTVLENIIMGSEAIKNGCEINFRKDEATIRSLCKQYGFNFNLKAKISDLPIVLQQQVEIVKVLFRQAEVLIFDEPTAVLPPQEIEGLFRAFKALKEKGHTILFITHKLKEVLAVSDVITVMKEGEIAGTLRTEEANERILTRMMVSRDVILSMQKNPTVSESKTLEVRNLVVHNELNVKKVRDVSFTMHKGEILGLVGIAGNGQSELVNAITGMKDYESGEVLINGKLVQKHSPMQNRINNMGFIPQDRILVGCSTKESMINNVVMGTHLKQFRKKRFLFDYSEGERFTAGVTEKYRIKHQSIFNPVSDLSGGNIQKMIVGREFSQGNEILVIEDPTRGIDIGSIEFVWKEIISQVENEGVSVLLVTYDLHEAMELSDRIMVIYNGEILKTFDRSEFDENEIGLYMLGGSSDEN